MDLGDGTKRKLCGRLSIAMGNSLQIAQAWLRFISGSIS